MIQRPAPFVLTLPAPDAPASPPPHTHNRSHKALWLIGLGLLANAAVLLYTRAFGQAPEIALDRAAFAQAAANSGQMLGARGLYMMPGQIGPQTFGVYLMDVDSGTFCVYRVAADTGHLKLMAARSFKYDRFLEDFNNDSLRPSEVRKLVEDQRQRQDLHQKDDQPTVDPTPKPDDNLPDMPAANAPK